MNKLFTLNFLILLTVFLIGCQISQRNKEYKIKNHHSKNELENQSLESLILALPKFRYHEESAEDFKVRVMSARKGFHNIGKDENFLYVTGDGSFPPKEFKWNKTSKTLTVKSFANEIDPSITDVWKVDHGKLAIRVSPR